jgi:hypothetical protein
MAKEKTKIMQPKKEPSTVTYTYVIRFRNSDLVSLIVAEDFNEYDEYAVFWTNGRKVGAYRDWIEIRLLPKEELEGMGSAPDNSKELMDKMKSVYSPMSVI